jgi:hypothetical protein
LPGGLFGSLFSGALGPVLADPAKFLFDFVVTVVFFRGFELRFAASEGVPLFNEMHLVDADHLKEVSDVFDITFRSRWDQDRIGGFERVGAVVLDRLGHAYALAEAEDRKDLVFS